jgi:hypothetical protein
VTEEDRDRYMVFLGPVTDPTEDEEDDEIEDEP